MTSGMRSALALVSVCQDALDPHEPGSGAEPLVTIVVDAEQASETGGETGATVVGGPRVGPNLLEEMLCIGRVEVNVSRAEGTVLGMGPTSAALPPRLRRHMLSRDHACVVDSCSSRYRLQVHHKLPRSRGGTHDPTNLAAFCWFHHHVKIHGMGFTIDPALPPGRVRLIPPEPLAPSGVDPPE